MVVDEKRKPESYIALLNETLLSTESFQAIEAKREEAQKRADKLQQEIDELQKAIDKAMR